MDAHFITGLIDAGYFLLFVGLPGLICLPILPIVRRWHPVLRYLLSVIVSWIAIQIYALAVSTFYRLPGAIDPDQGIEVDVARFLGWLPVAFFGAPFCLIAVYLHERMRRNRPIRTSAMPAP